MTFCGWWLATSRYVNMTADVGVLEEPVGYLEGRPLDAGEESYYDLPVQVAPAKKACINTACVPSNTACAAVSHGLP